MKVLGRHDVICRLPAVLLSAATPPLLYALGRSIYRPTAGAAAAAAFVVLPITLSFANFNALEVPVMAWTLLGLVGYVRLLQTSRRRYLALSALGPRSMHADWPAFVLTGGLLAFGAIRAYLLPRRVFGLPPSGATPRGGRSPPSIAALTAALYLALFQHAGKLGDLLTSYGLRSSGNAEPLSKVLESRRYSARALVHADRHRRRKARRDRLRGAARPAPARARRAAAALPRDRDGAVRRLPARRRHPHLLAALLRGLLRPRRGRPRRHRRVAPGARRRRGEPPGARRRRPGRRSTRR